MWIQILLITLISPWFQNNTISSRDQDINNNDTALHKSVRNAFVECCEYLVQNGSDINSLNNEGFQQKLKNKFEIFESPLKELI